MSDQEVIWQDELKRIVKTKLDDIKVQVMNLKALSPNQVWIEVADLSALNAIKNKALLALIKDNNKLKNELDSLLLK